MQPKPKPKPLAIVITVCKNARIMDEVVTALARNKIDCSSVNITLYSKCNVTVSAPVSLAPCASVLYTPNHGR